MLKKRTVPAVVPATAGTKDKLRWRQCRCPCQNYTTTLEQRQGSVFTVTLVNGSAADLSDAYSTDSLHFEGLKLKDAVELLRLAFQQGFEVVVRCDVDEGNADEQA